MTIGVISFRFRLPRAIAGFLHLCLEFKVELDSQTLPARGLDPFRLFLIGTIDLAVMLDLAWLYQPVIELLFGIESVGEPRRPFAISSEGNHLDAVDWTGASIAASVDGYLFRGSQPPPIDRVQTGAAASMLPAVSQMTSLEQMKHLAQVKAQPFLDKLKTDPNNNDLLFQVGNIYKATHQFQEAIGYYKKASQNDPKNIAVRTELASCMYYNGDVEGAIKQLQRSLQQNPKDANSLFNLGLIKWQGKQDGNGALAAWQELLRSNPTLSADRKATVQKLIAEVKEGRSQLQSATR